MTRVVIAGAGVAGLSIALAIRKADPRIEVVVLERAARPGGNIRTEHAGGYACEWGPDGFLDNAPDTLRLVDEVGLGSRMLPSNDAARRRFIFRNGRLAEVPTSPPALVASPLLSVGAKARLVCEPFARKRPAAEESIHEFAARRIGREAADILVGSMVSGIFAGDARELSLRACFPKMWQLEEDHGGLVRALIATARRRRPGAPVGMPSGRLTSFVGGMSELVDGLARALGPALHTSSGIQELIAVPAGTDTSGAPPCYIVRTADHLFEADAVVLTGSASDSAGLVRGFDRSLALLLEGIPTAPLAVVCLGYDEGALAGAHPLNGFGFLVPRTEKIRILGTLFETSIYPNRAPAGKALLRVMIGGACDPAAVALDDDGLLEVVRRDLAATMGLRSAPEFTRIIRHRRGIPQYVKGHLARMRQIDSHLAGHPGLFLAGNSYRGVSINACIAESGTIAAAVLKQVRVGRSEMAAV